MDFQTEAGPAEAMCKQLRGLNHVTGEGQVKLLFDGIQISHLKFKKCFSIKRPNFLDRV